MAKPLPICRPAVKLRVTMQWREPLDPNVPSIEQPIYPATLRLFQQLDPNGEKRPSDEMAEVRDRLAVLIPFC